MPEVAIAANWLAEHLDDPEIAIADCRFALMQPELGRQQYGSGHIPGAFYFDLNQDLSSPVQTHGGRHPLPDLDKLAEKLSRMGITSSTAVIAYDDSRFGFAARFWWLLRYLGHDRVFVLDGGFTNWQNLGYPVTTIKPSPKTGQFIPQIQTDWIVDIETVKAKKDLSNVALIDSREPERYRGERELIDPIAGHIPGAVNYPWQLVSDDRGFLKLDDRWADLESKDEILVYCGSGVTACVNLLALMAAGIDAKLYPGSWSDWCSYLV
ncbi:MAG: sulfurtransferase [Plectolyngbya sp. WJT66-NPBG17]|jgi:thiosulfate/3-mercaptopyruvate sulfurtransferase|nr:sulfurtransferase [Plectolyngbya sp. WJT66-NPBG17]MBW4527453.1 sulfurtransferase [Phormidium tanganyikae FI6-MK23]